MTSIEQKILACSTELSPDSFRQQRLRNLMSHEMDVDHLINMAIKEGLACLLYKNLLKSGVLDTLSYNQRETLRSLYHQTVLFNLKLIHDLNEVLHQVNQEKIQVVLMQGIVLLPIPSEKAQPPLIFIPTSYGLIVSGHTSCSSRKVKNISITIPGS